MKKYILLFLSLIVLLTHVSCNTSDEESSSKYPELFSSESSSEQESAIGSGTLTVDGVKINADIEVYPSYAKIPLIAVLKGFGAEISTSAGAYAIVYEGKNYVLDMSSKTLCLAGTSENLLPQSGNENYVLQSIGSDIVLDDVSLYKTLDKIGISIRYDLSFDSLSVAITKK